jgi:hypothetical protein
VSAAEELPDAVLVGIAQTIHDRGEGDYHDVLRWMEAAPAQLAKLLTGFDLELIEWYFEAITDGSRRAEGYPHYDRQIGPAVDVISDAYRLTGSPTRPSQHVTVRGRFVDAEAATLFIDAFNDWAGHPEIDALFARTDVTPSGDPESDYEIGIALFPRTDEESA